MHIANSALHQQLTDLASPKSFENGISQLNEDISEKQFPATAAQLVLPCNSGGAEEVVLSVLPADGHAAENTAVLESKGRSQVKGPQDESAQALCQLSQQRLLDLADQTLAALSASEREPEANALHDGDKNSAAALSNTKEQIGFGKPSAAYPASTLEVRDGQEGAGTERVLQNSGVDEQISNVIFESSNSAPAPSAQYSESGKEAGLPSGILQTKGIACFLPKSTNLAQLSAAVAEGSFCEVERNVLNGRLKSVTVYHGPCAVHY